MVRVWGANSECRLHEPASTRIVVAGAVKVHQKEGTIAALAPERDLRMRPSANSTQSCSKPFDPSQAASVHGDHRLNRRVATGPKRFR